MFHFINCFEVPAGRESDFLSYWREVNDYMRAQPGYVSHTLYRSAAPDATYRFVNTAQWESAAALGAAHDDGFRRLALRPEGADFRSVPAGYEVAHQGTAATGVTVGG